MVWFSSKAHLILSSPVRLSRNIFYRLLNPQVYKSWHASVIPFPHHVSLKLNFFPKSFSPYNKHFFAVIALSLLAIHNSTLSETFCFSIASQPFNSYSCTMKSNTLALAAGLAAVASASPDYCPAATVTITQACAPGQTAAPGSSGQYSAPGGQYGASTVTIFVTETKAVPPTTVTITSNANAAPITVTQTTTVGGQGPPVTVTNTDYHSLPPPPGGATTYTTSTTAASGSKQTHHVDVGTFDGAVKFVPDNVNAEIGDVVEYNFLKQSHSLTQSEFLTPCTYNGGFDTGLNQVNPMNTSGLFVIPFEVKTKKPQWFYCKQPGPPNHCGRGMVFGLNPGDKMDAFRDNAIRQNGNNTGAASLTSAPTPSATGSPSSPSTGATTTVTVGLDNGKTLKFSPAFLPKASVGEKIHFDFRAVNHTLTESSLENPCKKLSGTDIDTNFMNVNKADVPEFAPFDLTVRNDKPRFFYCKQANGTPNGHCSKGMVFAINTNEATFDKFLKNAEANLPKIKGRTAA